MYSTIEIKLTYSRSFADGTGFTSIVFVTDEDYTTQKAKDIKYL